MKPVMKARFLREEGGFTLVEMMVTLTIWIAILFTLYSVFDQSIRVYSVGNNKVEAAESARLGLEKMEREIRAAYPVDTTVPANNRFLFFSANGASPPTAAVMPTASQITFGNELGAEGAGDGKILCGTPCEYITYKLTNPASNTPCTASPCTLRRINAANSDVALTYPGQYAVVENVALNGLTFTYLRSDGTPATTEGQIATVLVRLRVDVDPNSSFRATQTLTTEIDLRNR